MLKKYAFLANNVKTKIVHLPCRNPMLQDIPPNVRECGLQAKMFR